MHAVVMIKLEKSRILLIYNRNTRGTNADVVGAERKLSQMFDDRGGILGLGNDVLG